MTNFIKQIHKILHITIICLVFFLPLLFDPHCYDSFELPKVTLLRILTLIILTIWGFKIVYVKKNKIKERLFSFPVIFIPIIFYGFILIFSTFLSCDILSSILGTYKRQEGVITVLNYFLICFIASNFIKEKKIIKYIIYAAIISATITSIYAIFQHFGYDFLPTKAGEERSFSTLNHPNFLAAFLIMVLPFCLVQILQIELRLPLVKLLYFFSFLILYLALLFTYCRGAWLGFLFSFLIVLFFLPRRYLINNKLWLTGLIISLISITIIVNSPKVGKSNFTITERALSTLKVKEGSVRARLTTYDSALKIIKSHLFLGTGFDTFRLIFPIYKNPNYVQYEGLHITADKAHQQMLHIAANTGIIGLFGYLWIIITYLLKSYSLWKRSKDVVLVGLFASTVAFLIQNQFSFTVITIGVYFWLILGMVMNFETCDLSLSSELNEIKKRKKKREKIIHPLLSYLSLILIFIFLSIFCLLPYYADRLFFQGYVNQQTELYNWAIDFYQKAIHFNPYEEHYWIRLGEVYEKKADENEEYIDKAYNAYKKAVNLHPLNAYNYSKLGKVYAVMAKVRGKKYLDEALKVLEKAHKLDPHNPVFYNNLGAIYNDKKMPDKAIPYLKKAIALSPGYLLALNNLGISYSLKKDYQQAASYFKEAVKVSPSDVKSRERLAVSLFKLGKDEEAEEEFREILKLDPENSLAKQFFQIK